MSELLYEVKDTTGWDLRVSDPLAQTPEPSAAELTVLRDLNARTARAHAGEP